MSAEPRWIRQAIVVSAKRKCSDGRSQARHGDSVGSMIISATADSVATMCEVDEVARNLRS